MDGLKQQRRWQVKFILQQQLFQDEYSAVFYSIYYEPQPRGHCNRSGGNSRSERECEAYVGEASQSTEGQEA